MKPMVIASAIMLLSSCASMEKWEAAMEDKAQSDVPLQQGTSSTDSATPAGAYTTPMAYNGAAYQATRMQQQAQVASYQAPLPVNINHYVQGMMQDLIANLDQVRPQMVIGVTSFVYLDSAYDETNLLGNQLSESFMHEVHQFGLGVVDFKTTDFIRVTPAGDFVFSRDFTELKEEQPIEFVLGGTLVQHQGGTLVNARLVSVASKQVLATAQGFIPQPVVEALHQSGTPDKLMLKQGE